MLKKLFTTLLFVLAVIPAPASAHVLITDDSGDIGAVLHINPDDDPVAGEESTLFLDIQSGAFSNHAHDYSLKITGPDGTAVNVPLIAKGSSVSATYIFPERGAYTLIYAAVSDGHTHTFTHTQRISRGAGGNAVSKPPHVWAEFLMIAGGTAFVILLLIGLNRDKAIAIYSKW